MNKKKSGGRVSEPPGLCYIGKKVMDTRNVGFDAFRINLTAIDTSAGEAIAQVSDLLIGVRECITFFWKGCFYYYE